MFLEREEGKRGIYSTAYTNQVLDGVIRPYCDSLTEEQKEKFIFMEDRAKVH